MERFLQSQPTEAAIRKLQQRQSYLAKAPYQRRSKKKAIGDAAMKLCPTTWLAPTIIRAHDNYEYRKDRKAKEEVYMKYQEMRSASISTAHATGRSSYDNFGVSVDGRKERSGWSFIDGDPLEKTDDPWALPPIDEIASLGTV